MSKLKFNKERALALERFYSTRDIVAQRVFTLKKLEIQNGDAVIDIGSGPGFLCEDIAGRTGPDGRVLGLDISSDLVALSQARSSPNWLDYQVGDATALPMHDNSFDVAVCTQVAEYVADVTAVLSEIYRVLKPGGRTIVVATDWGALSWYSDNPERMHRVMQAWDAHCAHPMLPRKLEGLLRTAGFDVTNVDVFPIVNTRFEPESYSYGIAQLIRDFVVKGKHLDETEADAWHAELAALDRARRYYFTTARMFFSANKPD